VASGFATASFDHKSSYASSLDPSNGLVEKSNSGNYLNYQIGIGVNLFFNKDVAFEASLAYVHAERPFSEGFLVYANNPDGTSDILLNFKMSNFINLSSKTKEGEAPQYIRRGRQTLDVNGWYGKEQSYYTARRYKLSAQYSYLITNRLMLKANYHSENYFNDTRHPYVNVALSARYYLPMKSRFFMYPQLSIAEAVGHEPVSTTRAYNYYETSFGLGIGGSYFLSDNIALDATFLQARLCSKSTKFFEQPYGAGLLGIGNVGLLYFIR
jgi:opacity protein-like surface antigen